MNQYIDIKWQDGTVREVGVNGTQVNNVIRACIDRLQELNQDELCCRENEIAIIKLQEVNFWLQERTQDRIDRGVEGTMNP